MQYLAGHFCNDVCQIELCVVYTCVVQVPNNPADTIARFMYDNGDDNDNNDDNGNCTYFICDISWN
jgi:hypothetical protein